MTLSQSVVSELLDAFRAGEGVDLIRDAVQLVLQQLIETEATEQIGAARYERVDTRVTERNGARPRLLTTQAGDVELRIPKLRKGSFFPLVCPAVRAVGVLESRALMMRRSSWRGGTRSRFGARSSI
jgi:putative transposase